MNQTTTQGLSFREEYDLSLREIKLFTATLNKTNSQRKRLERLMPQIFFDGSVGVRKVQLREERRITL